MVHMLREIRQQPDALDRTLRGGEREADRLAKAIAVRRPAFVVLVARGSSDNAAQAGRYLIETTTGIPVSLAAPSVTTLYKRRLHWKNALVVGISQSGESTDVNMVVESARRDGALTVAITNESASALAGLAEHTFLVRAGKEHSVAATKTYTGQIMALYLLTRALGGQVGELERIPEWSAMALKLEDAVAERAARYRFLEHAVAVGRGLNYASAQEFALKLMETCYVVAERFSGADFMHGPIAMLEHAFPVFLFTPSGVTWPGMRALWKLVQELKSEVWAITDQSNRDASRRAASLVIPAALDEIHTPIPYIVPAQLFAAYTAAAKGLNPDQPRTLSKVTRTL